MTLFLSTPIISIEKKGKTNYYIPEQMRRIRSRNRRWKFFQQPRKTLNPLSSFSLVDRYVRFSWGATQHQHTTTFSLSPSPQTRSPSPQQQAGLNHQVDSTSINLRDITSQYSSGFTLLDAPFSSLISSSTRLI